jgi:hypothetical protein
MFQKVISIFMLFNLLFSFSGKNILAAITTRTHYSMYNLKVPKENIMSYDRLGISTGSGDVYNDKSYCYDYLNKKEGNGSTCTSVGTPTCPHVLKYMDESEAETLGYLRNGQYYCEFDYDTSGCVGGDSDEGYGGGYGGGGDLPSIADKDIWSLSECGDFRLRPYSSRIKQSSEGRKYGYRHTWARDKDGCVESTGKAREYRQCYGYGLSGKCASWVTSSTSTLSFKINGDPATMYYQTKVLNCDFCAEKDGEHTSEKCCKGNQPNSSTGKSTNVWDSTNKKCCPAGQKWDRYRCVDACPSSWTNGMSIDSGCDCGGSYTVKSNGHCCAANHHWDSGQNKCVKNCTITSWTNTSIYKVSGGSCKRKQTRTEGCGGATSQWVSTGESNCWNNWGNCVRNNSNNTAGTQTKTCKSGVTDCSSKTKSCNAGCPSGTHDADNNGSCVANCVGTNWALKSEWKTVSNNCKQKRTRMYCSSSTATAVSQTNWDQNASNPDKCCTDPAKPTFDGGKCIQSIDCDYIKNGNACYAQCRNLKQNEVCFTAKGISLNKSKNFVLDPKIAFSDNPSISECFISGAVRYKPSSNVAKDKFNPDSGRRFTMECMPMVPFDDLNEFVND